MNKVREMKLCASLLLSVGVTAQYADEASDRWGGSYNYVDAFNYGGKITSFIIFIREIQLNFQIFI